MDQSQEYDNPSQLLIAVLDSMSEPTCLVDDNGKTILNEQAKNLKKNGFDITTISKNLKINSSQTVIHQGVHYNIEKKDINHGTKSCVCKAVPVDDTIIRLTKSSEKLKKVLSAL